VSLPLAERLAAEVVCLDSRQIMRGMAIGSAQPTPQEMARVPHHLFGVWDPAVRMSAGDYGRLARRVLSSLEARGGRALLVGGSGLYLRGLAGGLAANLPHDHALRERLRERAKSEGSEALHAELMARDPATAARLHPRDAQRITRALEVIGASGRPLSRLLEEAPGEGDLAPRLRILILDRDRADLYARIELRTRALLAGGLIEEVMRLLEAGFDTTLPVFRAHGYPEVAAFLAGRLGIEALEARISQVTRNYAKRQLTWFRRLEGARWLRVAAGEEPEVTAARALEILTDHAPPGGAGAVSGGPAAGAPPARLT
jgi:tRNA dimethylallyltransferase